MTILHNSLIKSLSVLLLIACLLEAAADEAPDPAEVAIGERLFLETRFAQAYFATPENADPSVSHTITSDGQLASPFRGKTINCRVCHMVDEHQDTAGAGMRTYADFAPRSPVPARNDGQKFSGRNSMAMVNVSIPRKYGELFHYDGEFNSLEDLVRATLTRRNFGWLPGEEKTAISHVARVIRDDDGRGELARAFGGSYRKVLKSADKDLAAEFILPVAYRIDIDKASDRQIFDAVAMLISAYVRDLEFATNDDGHYIGSPYDRFLELNNLPRTPLKDETLAAYNQRLLQSVNTLKKPRFVTAKDDNFTYHKQDFAFAEEELAGMKLFLAQGSDNERGGNCAACHPAPHFSDFSFHNTGLTQVNYDGIHGEGKFMRLNIPDLSTRNLDYDRYLPATGKHPKASSRFRSEPSSDTPGLTDLGLWNVFSNTDMPNPQTKLEDILCNKFNQNEGKIDLNQCVPQRLLPMTIAAFKTPLLRDLGHSNPYMHTGQFNTVEEAVRFYITSSALARQQQLRNADPDLQHINLGVKDLETLVSFLKALNEDYD
ncbi:MAG: cytochrome c peroxidase [Gammaproteobacteria bacterium]|nr:cytochrome c peroxidase [Gammaproteobacteria bacterium]MDX2488382.1 cytochrome c peroxidase [Gammaproteobacteria bacterium]